MSGVERALALDTAAGAAVLAELAVLAEWAKPAAGAAAAGRDLLVLAERLRQRHDPELVAIALTQHQLRAAAARRFAPAVATGMLWTRAGLEQASRTVLAGRRAAALRGALGSSGAGRHMSVADLCCGLGADAVELARQGFAVTLVDRDPSALALAERNVTTLVPGAPLRTMLGQVGSGEVDALLDRCDAALVDPARRDDRGRVQNPQRWSPPFRALPPLAQHLGGRLVAKVAPGLGHELVPRGGLGDWVSVGGTLLEATLWWPGLIAAGLLLEGQQLKAGRAATVLTTAGTLLGRLHTDDLPDGADVEPMGDWLLVPDDAVLRAGLVAALAAHRAAPGADPWRAALIDPHLAFLTCNAEPPAAVRSLCASVYRVIEAVPAGKRALSHHLRSLPAGEVVVTSRGTGVDVVALSRELSAPARTRVAGVRHIVVLARVGETHCGWRVRPG